MPPSAKTVVIVGAAGGMPLAPKGEPIQPLVPAAAPTNALSASAVARDTAREENFIATPWGSRW